LSFIVNPYSFLDPDAQAFTLAAGITNTTQIYAINQLVLNLKAYGIWSKMKAIWPFVGGTSSSHKWNLKDPRDLDAAFRLVFFGGLTHNSAGITGNGTNGYFDTFLNDNTTLQLDNVCLSAYSSSNIARAADVFFCTTNPALDSINLNPRNASDLYTSRLHTTNLATQSNTNSEGFYAINRNSSSNYFHYKNNISTQINETSTAKQNSVILGLRADTTYSQRNISWMSIGDGLTSTEAANLYTAVQAYQTTLGRQV
jgi:hypothetical protein